MGSRFDALLEAWKEEEQAAFSGWDFSHLAGRLVLDMPPWSYEAMVRELPPPARSVLDLGTGGGERLAEFEDALPDRAVATEGYAPNIILAHERLARLGIDVVASNDSLAQRLPFAEKSFDLVIDRHTSFNIAEVERVLTSGGIFLTQQVDGRNLADLSEVFDTQQPWTFFTLDFVLEQIEETDLVIETAEKWSGTAVFKDIGALVYYLKAVPWIVPQGFSVAKHQDYLQKLQQRLEQEGELTFLPKLFLVEVLKTG